MQDANPNPYNLTGSKAPQAVRKTYSRPMETALALAGFGGLFLFVAEVLL